MVVENNKDLQVLTILGGVFALSGAAALLYQIVWQRLLFLVFGVDIEAVTIIVTVFMLGLGLGGLIGGWIADKWRSYCIPIFLVCELLIGFFGVFSRFLITNLHLSENFTFIFVQASLLLLVPTSLMGATLPLLSVALVQRGIVIADTVGRLYYFNTFGAALTCLLVGFFAFNYIGLSAAIYVAVTMNFIVFSLGFVLRDKWL